jgi:hypothetical protein
MVVNHQEMGASWAKFALENMVDSSETGSARTDLSAVDKFLADPANSRARGFNRALQQDNRSVGDAGLAEFRVYREVLTVDACSGMYNGFPGTSYPVDNFVVGWPSDSEFPPVTVYTERTSAQMTEVGQRLYLSAIPNRDQADLGTVMGEVVSNPVRALVIPGQSLKRALDARWWQRQARRSGIPLRARDRHRRLRGLPLEEARAAADDYLAYIFGVRPTINSLDQLAASINRSRQSAETVVRNSRDGNFDPKKMRRKRSLPSKVSTATESRICHLPSDHRGLGLEVWGLGTYSHESTQDVWFSASFRMDTSDTETWLDKCSEFFHSVDRVTGLGLDIRTAWDLIPFSFMVDWFTNTGDLLEERQVRADYNIVCEYGYIMCHTRDLRILSAAGVFNAPQVNRGGSAATVHYERLVETKQRNQCKSFGFLTDFSSLNPFQWSALTALGLSNAAGLAPRKRS